MPETPSSEHLRDFWCESGEDAYERISPTAWMVARRRSFTDIPYAQEMFAALEQRRIERNEPDIPEELKTPELTPQFEARYKLVNRLLREVRPGQILEIASGLSPRGLEFTELSDFTVVEVDLPGVMALKQEIVTRTLQAKGSGSGRPNLHLETGNVLKLDDLLRATEYLKKSKPLAVVNEGLLRYLNFNEKAAVAKNVRNILDRFGGTWITPDITLRKVMEREGDVAKGQNERVKQLTGIDIDKNRFENVDHAQVFFEELGFEVERHKFDEVRGELVSPERLNIPSEEADATIAHAWAFVMRPRR